RQKIVFEIIREARAEDIQAHHAGLVEIGSEAALDLETRAPPARDFEFGFEAVKRRNAESPREIGAFLRLGRNLFGRALRGYPGDVERTGEFGCSTLPGHISQGSGKSISP